MIQTERVKRLFRLGLRDLEPLVVYTLLLFDTHAAQIDVEVLVVERHAGPVFEHGVALPLQRPSNPRRMRLFTDSRLHVALRIADLRPTVVVRHARRDVGVDHRRHARRRVDVWFCHRCALLLHRLDVRFNELDLSLRELVLLVQLFVDLLHRPRPVDVGG